VQILTVLPKSWSVVKVEEEFAASNYMAHKIKELVEEQDIFSSPNPKQGAGLPLTTVKLVQVFIMNHNSNS